MLKNKSLEQKNVLLLPYSEKKADLLRGLSAELASHNAALDEFLASLTLEQLELHSNQDPLPQVRQMGFFLFWTKQKLQQVRFLRFFFI